MANCSKCGFNLPESAKFCDNCGAKAEQPVATYDTTPATTPQQPPVVMGRPPQPASTAQQSPIGAGVPSQQPPVGSGMPPQQQPMGSGVPPQQPPVGVGRPPQQQPVGAGRPPQQPPVGAGRPPQQPPVGSGRPPQQPPMGSGMPPQQPPMGAGRPPQQPPMGVGRPTQQPPMGVGMPPQQPPYNNGAPMQQRGGVSTTTKPTNKGKLFGIIGIAVAVIVAIIIAIVFILPMLSGSNDENLGIYTATEVTVGGVQMHPEEAMLGDEVTLELKSGGKCTLILQDESFNAEWSLDGTVLTITDGSDTILGKLEGNSIMLTNILSMGFDIHYIKGDGSSTTPDPDSTSNSTVENSQVSPIPQTNNSELAEYWTGAWYGIISFYETDGIYSDLYYDTIDAYIVVNIDEGDMGQFTVYATDTGEAFIAGDCEVSGGESLSLSGINVNMGNTQLSDEDWKFLPSPDFDDKFTMSTDIVDNDGNFMSFVIFMKPFGASWQEEVDSGFHEYPEYDSADIQQIYNESDAVNTSSTDTLSALGNLSMPESSGDEELYSLDFTLINNSGANIVDVRLSEDWDTSFGENILPAGTVLYDGESIDIEFDFLAAAGTIYDMYTLDDDGDEYEYYGLELTKITTVTLYWEREADGSYTNVYTVE